MIATIRARNAVKDVVHRSRNLSIGARTKIVLQLLVQLYTSLTRAISIEARIKQMVDWRRMPMINTSRSISVSRTTAVWMALELDFFEG